MLFNSLAFLIFAPIFYLVYFATKGRARLLWCTLASYFFYAWWDYRFVLLIAGSTLVAFYSGKGIAAATSPRTKLAWLWACVGSHLAALGFFKYFGFCADSLKTVAHWLGMNVAYETPRILLPVGISFFTFTALSYIIDVYRKKIAPAEKDLLVFATYECLFPHLVAGPILRASKFLPQLKVDHLFDWRRAGQGTEMILWGFFLKLCLADNAALFADPRFNNPELFTSASLILAVVCFAFQIYGDFAGYSLIAIGLARIMGYDFGMNFNKPYFASNFSEFWQRWHISLSSWIRDYLYIPLGGNQGGTGKTFRNLFVTMFLAGLWHGAGWNFVVWGLLHGAYLAGQRAISKPLDKVYASLMVPAVLSRALGILTVFLLTCFAWVFFRCHGIEQSLYMVKALFSWDATSHLSFGGMKFQLLRVAVLCGIVLLVDAIGSNESYLEFYTRQPFKRAMCSGLIVVIILFTGNFASNSFIYFQF